MRWSSIKAGDIGWVAEYQKRMRRFNLIVILAARIFLVILIACWWLFHDLCLHQPRAAQPASLPALP